MVFQICGILGWSQITSLWVPESKLITCSWLEVTKQNNCPPWGWEVRPLNSHFFLFSLSFSLSPFHSRYNY